MKTRRERILDRVSDLVGELMYYRRKEDAELPRGAIEAAVAAGEVSTDEIVACFAKELRAVKGMAPRTPPPPDGCLPGECRCEARGTGCLHRQL